MLVTCLLLSPEGILLLPVLPLSQVIHLPPVSLPSPQHSPYIHSASWPFTKMWAPGSHNFSGPQRPCL